VDYDRRVLVLDAPDGALQKLALQLMGHGLSLHYVNDVDEAQLLAQQERGHIGAVLLGPCFTAADVQPLQGRLGVAAGSLIATGPRPCAEEEAHLAAEGLRWHLWGDPGDDTIRFVLYTVLSEQDPLEIRFHMRVPTRLPAVFEGECEKGDVEIRDVSLGGACLMGSITGQLEDPGILRFSVGDDALELACRLAWGTGEGGDAVSVVGVSFSELDPDSERVLGTLVQSVVASQRIASGLS